MKLELVSLQGIEFSDDVYEVIIPTADGEIGVYPGHMPLVSVAIPGVLKIRRKAGDRDLEVYASLGGVVEINEAGVRLLVDDVERSDEILESEAKAALEAAQKLKSAAKTEVELEKAQAMVDRQAIRLQVAALKHRKIR